MFTVSPRVFFGRRAVLMPSPTLQRVRRFSMFSGVGSNASPAATASRPL